MDSEKALKITLNGVVSSRNRKIDLILLKCLYELTDKSNIVEVGSFVGGKSLILGALALENKVQFSTFDTFQRQLSLGLSIEQSKTLLKNNLSLLDDISHITIHVRDSTSKDIQYLKNISYFCIDGNHNEPFVYNDICNAKNILTERGCIIVDDINAKHPGVLSGFFSFISNNQDMIPIIFGLNHVWIIRRSQHSFWRENIPKNILSELKETSFLGQKVFSLNQKPGLL